MLDLSIAVISFNTRKMTLDAVKSVIHKTRGLNYEIIVVDNASSDGSVEALKNIKNEKSNIKLIFNRENLGFAKANNQAFGAALGRYFLLLNSDTLISDNILREMVAWLDAHPKVGVVGCALKNADGTLQGSGGYFPTLFRVFAWMFFLEDLPVIGPYLKPFHPMHPQSPFGKGVNFFQKERNFDWVTGAFLLVRAEVYRKVKGLDEDYFMYTEEVDMCYKIKKLGWEVWYLPKWSITHFGGASGTSGRPLLGEYEGIKIFYTKRMPRWQRPLARIFLKTGALLRIIIFGILKGPETAKIYAKAFWLG